ncbi:MAG: type IV pilus assembly protein PilM [bacterium]
MGILSSPETGYLGIDMGSSGVKIVELTKVGDQAKLLSYGFSENLTPDAEVKWRNDNDKIAELIVKTIAQAGMKATSVVASLPAYSVFSSIINLIDIDKEKIDQAVEWETKKVLPVPIEDVVLEWRLIESRLENNRELLKIFVIAAPRVLVTKYQDIFKKAKLKLINLESETFSLIRALMGRDKTTIMIAEFGATTTNVSIIERGIPFLNRSIEIGGDNLSKILAQKMSISLEEAEQLKFDLGISAIDSADSQISETIQESLSPLVNEIKYLIGLYQGRGDKKVEKLILTGGSALISNLANYLSRILNMNVIVGDSWSHISYPLELKPLLTEISPRLSVAAGLALDRFE